jgi:hypothetical protein
VASRRIGRNPVQYVSNIFKYYVAYKLVAEQNERREAAREKLRAAEGELRPQGQRASR